ncbi:uncharacterized protein N7487_010909 [Penicillium crustosum]|uniref:uncharacterized protein n=1 Tax=Penicillium crustosum TaxID=36656 RepID=UPI0023A5D902|nr:uncharacterized protein N7487_010909 [Penicillium crustosum]KAJ5393268.1 hypothetical protein N7487_010909 [Penicillium crustosum]
MSRSKKTVALRAASKSGAPQPEIKADKIHRFPVIVSSPTESIAPEMNPTNSYGIIGAKPGVNEDNTTYDHCIALMYADTVDYCPYMPSASEFCQQTASMSATTMPFSDRLLDLLENGVFDAFLRGVLHAVQFTVIADKASPNKILESYTFTFDNFGERSTADRLTNGPRMDFVSPHEDRASMRNMIFEGKALIRRLRTMCAESPPLPNERSLGIHDNTIEYSRTLYWERTRRFYGSVDSGFHTLGLRVSSLRSTSPGGEAYFPSAEEANDDIVIRSGDVGIPTPAQMPLDVVGEIYVSTDESTAGDGDENKVEDRIFFNEEDLENYQSWVHKKAQLMAEAVKADSDDSSETKFVAKLPRPERSRKSSIPLNWPEEEANFPVSRDSVHSSQARRKSREDFSPENYIRRLQTAGSKPTVKARTVAYVENRHGVTEKLDKEKKDKIENLPGPSDSMTQYGHRDQRHYRCECNTWNFKPRKSIQCANCKDWQHTLCYGYYSARDERIPDIHYCYSCLIGYDFDSDLMEELIKLIRTRRIIYFVVTVGRPPTLNWQVAGELNRSDDEAHVAVHSIRKLGIMRSEESKKLEHYHKIGSSKFLLNKTIPACNTICSEILDPMLLIEEYYDIPPPISPPMVRSHWSKSGVPLFGILSESVGIFFEGQTSNSVSKRLLDSKDEEFGDVVYTREAKKMKLK